MKYAIKIMTVIGLVSAGANASEVAHYKFDSEVLGAPYPYTLYTPDGFGESDKRYPVMYLLHGSFGSENDWASRGSLQETADALIAQGKIPPALIVMPGNQSWWVDGNNEPAATAFIEDLLPHIESTWPAIREREGRVIGGLSAGGYGTINFVFQHPDLFVAGAALSPAIYASLPPEHSSARRHPAYLDEEENFSEERWKELNYPSYIDDYMAGEEVVPLYINSGDHDTFDIAYHATMLYQALREHQPNQVELRIVDGDHEWNVWKDTLPEAMEYVFSFASRPLGALPE
ncbi:MAG: esterase family protein [Halomonas sp.]|nr:alpha/beta hydrolase-fold protein [Halomonas sp.]NQY75722.1 esterase family protein [Halomonas sp.]